MEGNISGIRPGITLYHSYYDYPTRQRYQYDTQDVVYDFTAGKVYKIKSTGKCCYSPNTDESTGEPATMIAIAPSKNAVDEGSATLGEDWRSTTGLIVMKEVTDWYLTSENAIAGWYQDITVGKDGSSWMTVDVDYTNIAVGNLTDADFLTSVTATCTSTCAFSEWEDLARQSGMGFNEPDEEENGFDGDCTTPTDVEWGAMCRMQELCGTGCDSGHCMWSWPTGTSMDDPATACACSQCTAADFFLH